MTSNNKRPTQLGRAVVLAVALIAGTKAASAQDITDHYRCVPQPILDLRIDETTGEWRLASAWSTSPYILSYVKSQYAYYVRWAGNPRSVGYWCSNPPVDGVFYCWDFTIDTNTMRFTRLQLRGGDDDPGFGPRVPADGALLELGFCEAIPPGTPAVDFSGGEQPQ